MKRGLVKFMGNYVTRDSLEGHFYFLEVIGIVSVGLGTEF